MSVFTTAEQMAGTALVAKANLLAHSHLATRSADAEQYLSGLLFVDTW